MQEADCDWFTSLAACLGTKSPHSCHRMFGVAMEYITCRESNNDEDDYDDCNVSTFCFARDVVYHSGRVEGVLSFISGASAGRTSKDERNCCFLTVLFVPAIDGHVISNYMYIAMVNTPTSSSESYGL